MDALLDTIAVFAACADLSVDVTMGAKYPTLTVRQGPGLYLCGSALVAMLPYLAALATGLGLVSYVSRRRALRRVR